MRSVWKIASGGGIYLIRNAPIELVFERKKTVTGNGEQIKNPSESKLQELRNKIGSKIWQNKKWP